MARRDREDYRADAIGSVFMAYNELSKTIGRSGGASIDDLQAAVEHLLDAVKVARKDALRLAWRPEPLLRAASGPRQSQ
jgi:2-keto-3-deoxy-L-rhamnonate aldolase RhmA